MACFLFYTIYFSSLDDISQFWYFLGGGVLVGIILGCILARPKMVKVGSSILAGWGGYCVGLILVETIFAWTLQDWLFWVVTIGCAVAAGVLAFIFLDMIVLVSTVVLGSYATMRGVSCYGGHYYNEFTMAKMIKDGLLEEIDPLYWAYIGLFFALVLIGGCVQYRALKKERNDKARSEHLYNR